MELLFYNFMMSINIGVSFMCRFPAMSDISKRYLTAGHNGPGLFLSTSYGMLGGKESQGASAHGSKWSWDSHLQLDSLQLIALQLLVITESGNHLEC